MLPILTFISIIFANGIKPGPGILFFTSLTLSEGIKPTLITALGADTASFIMVLMLLLGLDYIQLYPDLLFAIKVFSIFYIFYLGVTYFLQKHTAPKRQFDVKSNLKRYITGFSWPWVNPLNIAVYTAIIPYLIEHDLLTSPLVAVALALSTSTIYFLTRLPYMLFAAKAMTYLNNDAIKGNMSKFTGIFCVAISVFFFVQTLPDIIALFHNS